MPTYLGGTYGPSIASQQTPEVQSIMAKRTQWAANSVERNQQLINALEPEELKQYRSALNPTQQAQFDQLIQFRLQDEQKKQDPQYLRSIDTSAITPSRAALMRQRGNVSSSQ